METEEEKVTRITNEIAAKVATLHKQHPRMTPCEIMDIVEAEYNCEESDCPDADMTAECLFYFFLGKDREWIIDILDGTCEDLIEEAKTSKNKQKFLDYYLKKIERRLEGERLYREDRCTDYKHNMTTWGEVSASIDQYWRRAGRHIW